MNVEKELLDIKQQLLDIQKEILETRCACHDELSDYRISMDKKQLSLEGRIKNVEEIKNKLEKNNRYYKSEIKEIRQQNGAIRAKLNSTIIEIQKMIGRFEIDYNNKLTKQSETIIIMNAVEILKENFQELVRMYSWNMREDIDKLKKLLEEKKAS